MAFFTSAINILALVAAIGLAVWGVIRLQKDMEMTIPEPMLMCSKESKIRTKAANTTIIPYKNGAVHLPRCCCSISIHLFVIFEQVY